MENTISEYELAGAELVFASKFYKEEKRLLKILEVIKKEKSGVITEDIIKEKARNVLLEQKVPDKSLSLFSEELIDDYWNKVFKILDEYNTFISYYLKNFYDFTLYIFVHSIKGCELYDNVHFNNLKELVLYLSKYLVLDSNGKPYISNEIIKDLSSRINENLIYPRNKKILVKMGYRGKSLFRFERGDQGFLKGELEWAYSDLSLLIKLFSFEKQEIFKIRKTNTGSYVFTEWDRNDLKYRAKSVSNILSFTKYLEEKNISQETLINRAPIIYIDSKKNLSYVLGSRKIQSMNQMETCIKNIIASCKERINSCTAIPLYYLKNENHVNGLLQLYLNKRARTIKDLINLYEDESFKNELLLSTSAINLSMNKMIQKFNDSIKIIDNQLFAINEQMKMVCEKQTILEATINNQTHLLKEQNRIINQIQDVNMRGFASITSELINLESSVDSLNREVRSLDLSVDVNIDNTVKIDSSNLFR